MVAFRRTVVAALSTPGMACKPIRTAFFREKLGSNIKKIVFFRKGQKFAKVIFLQSAKEVIKEMRAPRRLRTIISPVAPPRQHKQVRGCFTTEFRRLTPFVLERDGNQLTILANEPREGAPDRQHRMVLYLQQTENVVTGTYFDPLNERGVPMKGRQNGRELKVYAVEEERVQTYFFRLPFVCSF